MAIAATVLTSACGLNVDDPRILGEVTTLDEAPPPVHGGTLLVTSDARRAIVGDPDRHRVLVVDLETRDVRTITLEPGLELGRMAEDGAGHVHVVARRAGVIVEIDPESATEVGRAEVCEAPRGLAWNAASGVLHVACADGELLSIERGAIVGSLQLDADLRDVVVSTEGLIVTRFRSAQTILVDAGGTARARSLPSATLTSPASPELVQQYAPGVAIRAARSASHTVLVHQRARIGQEAVTTPSETSGRYSYSSRPRSDGRVTWHDPCGNAVAHVALTQLDERGAALHVGMPVPSGVTPIDVAVSEGGRVAIGLAGDPGGRYSAGPQVFVSHVEQSAHEPGPQECLGGEARRGMPGQVISVAFAGETLIAQTRSPSMLVVEGAEPIDLGGAPVLDTGHELFHLDLGGTIACATCHPGGADDGHVWTFLATGAVRTATLEGVVGLAPYHRAGDVPSFARLMDALEEQMDAPPLGDARVAAIESWLRSVPISPAGPATEASAIETGESVFLREGCGDCHVGALGSDRQVHAVGTEVPLLTAPLAGLALRAPYLHDGRAADLESVLAEHGVPAMSSEERSALVAYLTSR